MKFQLDFFSEPGKDVKIIFKNKKWWSSRKNNYYSQAKLIVKINVDNLSGNIVF